MHFFDWQSQIRCIAFCAFSELGILFLVHKEWISLLSTSFSTFILDKPSEEGSESDCDPESLRLIANGKTISSGGSEGTSSSSKNLYQLGIKPGSVVMALLIDTADESLAIANEQVKILYECLKQIV